jgi:predicted metalloprotease with PDZ domain
LRRLYENTQNGIQVNERTIFDLCKELTGQDWTERLSFLINTTEELPINELLPSFGLSYEFKHDKALPFGLKLQDKPEGVLIQQANRAGECKAGLSAHDVIVAIDGLKASEKLLAQYAKQQGQFTVFAFRRDEFIQFTVTGGEIPYKLLNLRLKTKPNWIYGLNRSWVSIGKLISFLIFHLIKQ